MCLSKKGTYKIEKVAGTLQVNLLLIDSFGARQDQIYLSMYKQVHKCEP